MNEALLEKVLSCPRLPSVPPIAVRVIEMTQDENVKLREIANTIQNDQGLATKILRTVNSPFYGLSKPCSTIHQAQLMLGLNGVKTLALGFSLVASLDRDADRGFNYEEYWRRAIYTAIASKLAANRCGCTAAEEAFLGGLLQDIGMVAMFRALGETYGDVLKDCAGKHSELGSKELETLELHHAEIGAMLAERWRLPEALIVPIRFHERPTAAPQEYQSVARCIGLGNIAAELLTQDDASAWVARFRRQASEWFGFSREDCDDLLGEIRGGASEIASLFKISIGEQPDVDEILTNANEKLVDIALTQNRENESATRNAEQLQRALHVDQLTGVASRDRFLEALSQSYDSANAEGATLSLALVDLDGLREINERFGWDVGDAVLAELARRLQSHFRSFRGMVGRCAGERFGVLLVQTDRAGATRLVQSFREMLKTNPIALDEHRFDKDRPVVTVSVGVATRDATSGGDFPRVEAFLSAADRALHAAKNAGGDCVRVFVHPRSAAA
ncbi:MAG: GGDEF domain-containing protein [Phycisphaeraceae bacterium]|nr:MAG: GGDEF domain-containing protein [Phycisphaeraceae bacterium]